MALWGSKQSDLHARIEDIQSGLSALAGLLGDSAGAAGKSAARGAHKAGEAAGEAAHGVSDAITPALTDLANQIDSVLMSVGSLTGHAADVARKEGKAAYKAVEGKVNDNAMIAVVTAAGVGLLVGAMIFGGGAARRAVANVLPESLGGEPERPQRRRPAQARSKTGTRRRRAA